ncbi:hypothetical protein [Ensifer sp. ENS03]|uniref:hypothetical protein n=1 Tax=Ensifer sp. ENS03 TaxID=2769283 RepID=UPI0017802342|nr:hypothetical protein [Ensifer sp. ENS03]MBD9561108.1 hypothetical protein [Ensifer sp. ENS03]
MKRTIIAALVGGVMTTPALSASDIDKNYIKSLAAPGKTVLVIEYYDGSGKVADRKGYATTAGFKAVSPTDFRVDDKTTLRLYGLEPCKGEMVNRSEDFAGSCDDFAQKQLQIMLQNPKVVFCRAFVSEQGAPLQNATCYGYYNFPGTLDSVDMFEEQLLSLGALRISQKPDGTPARSDLTKAEEIGQKGSFGMWADPRVKGQ